MTSSDPTPREADVTGRPGAAVLGTTLADALVPFLTAAEGDPFLTYVDGDDRTELSVATVANWASKLANLLLAEVDEAATVELATDGHWCAGIAALGSWRVGVSVTPADDGDPARPPAQLRIAHERIARPDDLAVGDGFGGRLSSSEQQQRSFVDEVLAEADDVDVDDPDPCAVAMRWTDVGDRVPADAAAVDLSLVAARLDRLAGHRALLLDALDSAVGLAILAAAVVHGASLVVVRGGGSGSLARLADTERVDLLVGSDAPANLHRPLLPVVLR